MVFSHIKRRGKVLILSHREELVEQPRKYYKNCSFGIERGEMTSHGEDVISASVQTLVNRLDKFSPYEFDIIITDEAHHAVAPTYRKIDKYFKPRLHIGFTATPMRGDKVGLDGIFDQIIYEKDILWGMEHEHLCKLKCIIAKIGYDLNDVDERNGDFKIGQLGDAMDREKVNLCVLKTYQELAKGQTIIFTVNIDHANHIADLINEHCGEGTAASITSNTKNRIEILGRCCK